MIATKDNNGVLIQSAVLQDSEKLPNLVIYKGACTEVCSAGTLGGFIWHRVVPEIDSLKKAG
jgi:hypothetical protein